MRCGARVVHIHAGLNGCSREGIEPKGPVRQRIKGRIGDEARDTFASLAVGCDEGGAVCAGENPAQAVKGPERAVAFDAGDVLVSGATGIADGHAGNGPSVPKVVGCRDHVVDIIESDACIRQGPINRLPGHVGEGVPRLLGIDLGHADTDDGCVFHGISLIVEVRGQESSG